MNTVRCFVAVELPEKTKEVLANVQAAIRDITISARGAHAADHSIKWVDPKGIHLTLKFLGWVPSDRLAIVEAALARAVLGHRPFCLGLDGLGAFPSTHRVRVAWVGLDGEVDRVISLQTSVERELAKLGFEPEARGFSPHLTLARVREEATAEERHRLGDAMARVASPHRSTFTVSSISLMRSDLRQSGPVYSRLALVPFASGRTRG